MAVLVAGSPALAADSRQEQERAARKACLSGQYAKGVDILSDLYIATRDPNYLFNQGRCFQQNWRLEEALGRFEEYLHAITVSPGPGSEAGKAEVEAHIARCRELLAERNAGKPTPAALEPPAPGTRPTQPAPTAEPAQDPVATATASPVTASEPAESSAGSGLRTAGVLLGIAGVAAGVAGVVLNLRANAVTSDIESTSGGYNPSLLSERDDYRTFAWVSYGTGATFLVAGTVLYILGAQRSDRAAGVALVPSAGAGKAGIVLTGAF